jgi:hypothetical protein
MMRQRLPNRRRAELINFEHNGLKYTAGISRFADGRVAELFLNSNKAGSDAADAARDAAIVASIALQLGCPVRTLRHALTRASDGRAAGPIGVVLDMLDGSAS